MLRPGDWLVCAVGALGVAASFPLLWGGSQGADLVIRSGGKVVVEASLNRDREFLVDGPLGTTLVQVAGQRARIARDPSPRQYCVKQGWLSRSGEAALCLPNQVAIEIRGARALYDSLNY